VSKAVRASQIASTASWLALVAQPERYIIHRKFGLIQLMRSSEKPLPQKQSAWAAAVPIEGSNAW
jgi:hypothetical protein